MATTKAAEAEEAKAAEKVKSGKVIKYIGTSDIRQIDSKSWHNVGSADQKTITWDASNKWMVPLDDFNAEAIAYCEAQDSELVITDAPTE